MNNYNMVKISLPETNQQQFMIENDDDSDDSSVRLPSQSHKSGYGSTRKRRRGVIEKKRRDRINHCLAELRSLLPQARDKQATHKLEKAEILHMAVQHLKRMHTRGIEDYGSLDYQMVGFRECLGEVGRYLAVVEGMDMQDPLRLRLISHLHCYAQQNRPNIGTTPIQASYSSYGSHFPSSIWQPPPPPDPFYGSNVLTPGNPSSVFQTPPHCQHPVANNNTTPTKVDWSNPRNL